MNSMLAAGAAAMTLLGVSAASAATIDLTLTAKLADFSEGQTDFQGHHFDQYSVYLTSADFPVIVSQGDIIDATTTFDAPVTIPASSYRTDLVQYFSGFSFPSSDTIVDGTYTFYNSGSLVSTYTFSSSTSGGLSAFTPLSPPLNTAFTFDSFTSDLTVTQLDTPGQLDYASFTYSLVSDIPAAPEPGIWALLILSVAASGLALRRSELRTSIGA